ncbi:MAG: hypothetical protein ACRCUU_07645 [Plesiomonas sp.]
MAALGSPQKENIISSAANWSYTANITIWHKLGIDDWTGAVTFAAPVVFMGDYSAQSERMVSAAGNDFVSKQTVFTEYSLAKEGDFVLIGESSDASPYNAMAQEVLLVLNYGDVFERTAPDYKLVT